MEEIRENEFKCALRDYLLDTNNCDKFDKCHLIREKRYFSHQKYKELIADVQRELNSRTNPHCGSLQIQ
jgi:hypothetical protein